jgi:hypothetical protein
LKIASHSGRRVRGEFAITEGLIQAFKLGFIPRERIKRLDKIGKWYTIIQ